MAGGHIFLSPKHKIIQKYPNFKPAGNAGGEISRFSENSTHFLKGRSLSDAAETVPPSISLRKELGAFGFGLAIRGGRIAVFSCSRNYLAKTPWMDRNPTTLMSAKP